MRLLVISALLMLATPALAQDGPTLFNKCSPCHAIGEGAVDKVGPQLNGVFGRAAASSGSYNYSQAMLKARDGGLVWTRQTLTRYLKLPKHLVPGTSMAFYGMASRDEIDTLLDYLESFAADGSTITP